MECHTGPATDLAGVSQVFLGEMASNGVQHDCLFKEETWAWASQIAQPGPYKEAASE